MAVTGAYLDGTQPALFSKAIYHTLPSNEKKKKKKGKKGEKKQYLTIAIWPPTAADLSLLDSPALFLLIFVDTIL